MYAVIGFIILIVMVFGGFAFTGGALGPVMHALPHEMLIIGGAAVGAPGGGPLIGIGDTGVIATGPPGRMPVGASCATSFGVAAGVTGTWRESPRP